ncbi:acyltransferase family protein [Paracoccus limosus]|uniref:Acyltransferase family protein n=1 Tax=Paracoccus limosus TaxID=913252 RepID=A0A844H8M8_9RHOB|nr:acyltransferase [Paracoccus limosus]MTH35701.1 acyltransferase family protein [Paracoccus limosus]
MSTADHITAPAKLAQRREAGRESSIRAGTQSGERLDGLTGLRGFAVLVVFLSHSANAGLLPSYFGMGVGQLGVMLFFILSGFLMSMLYLGQAPRPQVVRRYVAARLGRVLPLFYLIVALSLIATAAGLPWPYPMPDVGAVLMHLFLISGTRELWAVPVEIQFYVIFVGIWWLCHRQGGFSHRALWLCLAVLGLLFAAQVLAFHLHKMNFVTVFYYTAFFLTGTLIALYRARIMSLHARLADWAPMVLSLIALAAFVAVNPNFRAGTALGVPIWADPLIWAAMVLVFLSAMTGSGIFRLLGTPLLMFWGEISYGFYLIHPILLHFAEPLAGDLGPQMRVALVAVLCAATSALAWLSLTLFERPALKRAKEWA